MRRVLVATVLAASGVLVSAGAAVGSHTPPPTTVTLAGSLQSEVGCPGDWDPACAATWLTYDASDDVWSGTFNLPSGGYEYKVAVNGTWDESYPTANRSVTGDGTPVTFLYDHKSHYVADSSSTVIATAAGSFQSELGCPGDWQPDCLRSWLQDADGDGTYNFETTVIPPGAYEAKVAIDQSWDENYGAGGAQNGSNIPFQVAFAGQTVRFAYDAATHVLSIVPVAPAPPDTDADGVADTGDVCPGTVFPDRATALKKNRYETNALGQFVSTNGVSVATLTDTQGCSLHQIVAAAGLGAGQLKFGITRSALDAWIASVGT